MTSSWCMTGLCEVCAPIRYRGAAGQLGDVQVSLDRLGELVCDVVREGIKRVPKAALPDELEGRAAHPAEYIDLLGAGLDTGRDGYLEL